VRVKKEAVKNETTMPASRKIPPAAKPPKPKPRKPKA